MATSRDYFQTEEKQNCPICLSDFKIPRQLPCMHSFCEKCLQDYLSSQEENLRKLKTIECPICRQAIYIPQEGRPAKISACLFPINVILQSILSDSKVKVEQPCDACHSEGISSQAQDICVVCEEAMCKSCSVAHRNQKISRNHVISSMEEFTSNPENVMKLAKGFTCPEHDGEAIDFYCKDHKTACCSKCCIVSHRNCTNVSDLKKELPSLLQEINPDSAIEQMKTIETHFKKFTEDKESNISLLESQVNDIAIQIRDLRKKINDVLDELERRLKMEGSIIYKEEMIRHHEENHHCQCLISSIRNSHMLLETVKKFGTERQLFLTTERMKAQLTSFLEQIKESYTKMETTIVQLEVNPLFQFILSADSESLATIISSKELQTMSLPCIRKSSRNCHVQQDRVIEINDNDDSLPIYSSIIYLYSGNIMLGDYNNNRVCLLDSSYNIVSSYKQLPCSPCNICVINNNEVAVTLWGKKAIQLISIRDKKITPTRMISTRYACYGVTAGGKGEIIISGWSNDIRKHYWSLISSGGKEESCHEFDCQCSSSWTSVAVDSSFKHVYISVHLAHSLYCFDMSGRQKFIYNHDSLKNPRGVANDRYDNVYVVGYCSNNIHQLTPDGILLQIICDGIPTRPTAICFNRDGNEFLVTSQLDKRKLYQYRLK